MTRLLFSSLILAALSLPSMAQAPARKPASPHETITATVGGKEITIAYARPYVKGRNVWEGNLAPFGKVWRTGADDATTITVSGDTMLGALHVPSGTYSLFTIPGATEWTLIINKTAKQWGAFNYDEKQDLGRAKMTVRKIAPVEQFTIAIEPAGGNKATLKLSWSDLEASIPVMVH